MMEKYRGPPITTRLCTLVVISTDTLSKNIFRRGRYGREIDERIRKIDERIRRMDEKIRKMDERIRKVDEKIGRMIKGIGCLVFHRLKCPELRCSEL